MAKAKEEKTNVIRLLEAAGVPCTHHILEKDRDYAEGVPIGVPFPNEDVFLLDGENRLV